MRGVSSPSISKTPAVLPGCDALLSISAMVSELVPCGVVGVGSKCPRTFFPVVDSPWPAAPPAAPRSPPSTAPVAVLVRKPLTVWGPGPVR